MKLKFPFYYQTNTQNCGPACLIMISMYYNKNFDFSIIEDICDTNQSGTSFENLSKGAKYMGFDTLIAKIDAKHFTKKLNFPCIALLNKGHFIVIYKVSKRFVFVGDPSLGLKKYDKMTFLKKWILGDNQGLLMFFEIPEKVSNIELKKKSRKEIVFFLLNYLKPYKFLIIQLGIGLLMASFIQLLFPVFTQILVDIGIGTKNIEFIYIILIAQITLFLGQTAVNIIKSWILLHISSRLNMKLVFDFLNKLVKLNIRFFESRKFGDLLQRIFDNKRIENFLTNSLTATLFAVINLLVFGIVLAIYSYKIFLIFAAGSIISVAWLLFFLKKRREIDSSFFSAYSENYNKIVQLIAGIRDIKLNSSQERKINDWEKVQIKLFRTQNASLLLSQYQQTGTLFITQLKNIFITFIAAQSVVNGEITIGMMMAVTFISGQLNVPIDQLIAFIQTGQDAELSSERIIEINSIREEDDIITSNIPILKNQDINIHDLSFKYDEKDDVFTLKNINLRIDCNKLTAIVGSSGSGKTTLLKVLLKYYEPLKGEVLFGENSLTEIKSEKLRKICGTVMQDSFIFTDTIAGNITLSSNEIDWKALEESVRIANLHEFIQSLPFKYHTRIGDEMNISQGQKQRLLIARAIYKNPFYLFLDEATNALDTASENIVIKNLKSIYNNKTVVVVAHRLSTVMNADKIVVMEKGEIVELGTHNDLIKNKDRYYDLIRNQLELNTGGEIGN